MRTLFIILMGLQFCILYGKEPFSVAKIEAMFPKPSKAVGLIDSVRSSRYSPDKSWLMYESLSNWMIIKSDGSKPIKLTSSRIYINAFQWSPSGNHIAYRALENKEEKLYIFSLKDKENRMVFEHEKRFNGPSWSPDGKLIAIAASQYKGDGTTGLIKSNLYLLNMKGEFVSKIDLKNKGIFAHDVNWHPDGQKIIITAHKKGYEINLETRKITELGDINRYVYKPQFSTNGKKVMFYPGEKINIYDYEKGSIKDISVKGTILDAVWVPETNYILAYKVKTKITLRSFFNNIKYRGHGGNFKIYDLIVIDSETNKVYDLDKWRKESYEGVYLKNNLKLAETFIQWRND